MLFLTLFVESGDRSSPTRKVYGGSIDKSNVASKVEEDEGVVKNKLPNEGTKEKKHYFCK